MSVTIEYPKRYKERQRNLRISSGSSLEPFLRPIRYKRDWPDMAEVIAFSNIFQLFLFLNVFKFREATSFNSLINAQLNYYPLIGFKCSRTSKNPADVLLKCSPRSLLNYCTSNLDTLFQRSNNVYNHYQNI